MRSLLVCCGLVWLGLPAWAQELPADLAQVPAKAAGFVHIKTADVWNGPLFEIYRDILPKAGAETLAMLEERIVPSLSSIDRVTVVLLAPTVQAKPGPDFAVLLHTNKPLDTKRFLGGLEEVRDGAVRYYLAPGGIALQVLSKNVVMMGSPGAPAAFAEDAKVSPAFAEALRVASLGKKSIVAALNPAIIPAQALAAMPPMAQPFARAKTILVSLSLGGTVELEADLGFGTVDEAKEAQEALQQLRQVGKALLAQGRDEMKAKLRQSKDTVPIYDFENVAEVVGPVFVLAMIKRGEELLDGIPITRKEQHVAVRVAMPKELSSYLTSGPVLAALLLPAVQKVREAASRTQDANNLKQLALAMHISHDIYRQLPPPAICDKNGKPLLSWRVAILPFIEQQQLYQQFKLDEPWDSDHNSRLLEQMPQIYQMTGAPASKTHTNYCVLVGPDGPKSALYRSMNDKTSFAKIQDGTSNTLMIVEANNAVPWTKPEDLTYNPKGPLPGFNRLRAGFNAAFCDGSVRFLANTIPEASLRGLITRDGGETVRID